MMIKRKWFMLLLELIIPISVPLILLIIRHLIYKHDIEDECRYNPFTIDEFPKNLTPKSNLLPNELRNNVHLLKSQQLFSEFITKANSSKFHWYIGYTPENIGVNRLIQIISRDFFNDFYKFIGFNNEDILLSTINEDNATISSKWLCGIVFHQSPPSLFKRNNSDNFIELYNINYTLRFPYTLRNYATTSQFSSAARRTWLTKFSFPTYPKLGPRTIDGDWGGPPGYMAEGFLTLQLAIDSSIIYDQFGYRINRKSIVMKRTPFPSFKKDPFLIVLQTQFPLLMILSFFFSAVLNSKNILIEKECGLKEMLKLYGYSSIIQWYQWFCRMFIIFVINSVFIVILFKIKINVRLPPQLIEFFTTDVGRSNIINFGKILDLSNSYLFFLFLFTYSLSAISFIFFMTTLFVHSSSGAMGCGVVWFLSYIPYVFLQQQYDELKLRTIMLFCLVPNVCLSFGAQLFGEFEGKGVGIQWHNFMSGMSVENPFSLFHIFLFFLFDTFLYFILALYIESLFPGKLGVGRRWHYPFSIPLRKLKLYFYTKPSSNEDPSLNGYDDQISLWSEDPLVSSTEIMKFSSITKIFNWLFNYLFYHNSHRKSKTLINIKNEESDNNHNNNNEYFEDVSVVSVPSIILRKVRKIFPSTTEDKNHIAVHQLNMSIYSNEITVLLGHNGAGKSTTINMLSGLCEMTTGEIFYDNLSFYRHLSSIRRLIGYCPQNNILSDYMSVKETLEFFSSVKQLYSNEMHHELAINDLIDALNLNEKISWIPKQLSGGQQRKLAVALALCGGSRYIILDEPTSNIDVEARQDVWRLLKRYRQNRTIIMSTHYIDEAELIGDRIVIMIEGKLFCYGSVMFLKRHFDLGYTIHCHLNHQRVTDDGNGKDVLRKIFNETQMKWIEPLNSISANEVIYRLKVDDRKEISNILKKLYENHKSVGIQFFTIKTTSLAEIFFQLHEKHENEKRSNTIVSLPQSSSMINNDVNDICRERKYEYSINYLTGWKLNYQRFISLFRKCVIQSKRDYLLLIAQFLIPIIFTLLSLLIYRSIPGNRDSPSLFIGSQSYLNEVFSYSMENKSRLYETALGRTLSDRSTQSSSITDTEKRFIQMVDIYQIGNYLNNTANKCTSTNITMDDYYICLVNKYGLDELNDRNVIGLQVEKSIININQSINHKSMIDMDELMNNERFIIYFNNEAYHTAPYSLNVITNFILQLLYENVTNNFHSPNDYLSPSSINIRNHPLPRTSKDKMIANSNAMQFQGFTLGFNIVWSYAFVTSSFVVLLIREKETMSKHLQLLTGTSKKLYWITTFLWHVINFNLPTIPLLILFFSFSIHSYIQTVSQTFLTIFIVLLYSWSALPLIYILSTFFISPVNGFTILTIINTITEFVGKTLNLLFLLFFPNYNFGQSFINYYNNWNGRDVCDKKEMEKLCKFIIQINETFPCCPGHCGDECVPFKHSYIDLEEPGIGKFLLSMIVQGFIYFFILILIEQNLFSFIVNKFKKKFYSKSNQNINNTIILNDDLRQEEDQIIDLLRQPQPINSPLILNRLSKIYSNGFQAVDNVSFIIHPNQCFGLLGINGAGKSSIFKMITNEIDVDSGDILLNGHNIKTNINLVKAKIGYCPQYDAILNKMTVRETLKLFGELRGIDNRIVRFENQLINDESMNENDLLIEKSSQKSTIIDEEIKEIIKLFDLSKYGDKLIGVLSGGNKRKVSVAIALLGRPTIVLLDEPTNGMDIKTKRFIWNRIQEKITSTTSILLTSHSMEECEYLCNRISIIVNGKLQCIGSTDELRMRYGFAFTIFIKLKENIDCEMLINHFRCRLEEKFDKFLNDDQWKFDIMERRDKLLHLCIRCQEQTRADLTTVDNVIMKNKNGNVIKCDDNNNNYDDYHDDDDERKESLKEDMKGSDNEDCAGEKKKKIEKNMNIQIILFDELLRLKNHFPIDDYQISQTTLEQILTSFSH
ncbi:hypothetical protein SNEBB_001199 [Seison nebaliae]|nr:hypothetical protein SNEBB_001199 [Seison nebaliae]